MKKTARLLLIILLLISVVGSTYAFWASDVKVLLMNKEIRISMLELAVGIEESRFQIPVVE